MKPNYSPSSNVRVQRGAAGRTWRSCWAVAMPCGGEAPSGQPARSACAHPAPPPSDMHFPFPGLHYFLERRARSPGHEGLHFPPCLFSLPCVLLPGEERSQAGQGKAGLYGCGLAGPMGIGLP